jgi:hypothetical protein
MKLSVGFYLLTIIVVVLGFSESALAYIDPAAGSVFLQLLLGGVAGVIVVLKLYWHKFIGFFRRNPQEESERFPADDQK